VQLGHPTRASAIPLTQQQLVNLARQAGQQGLSCAPHLRRVSLSQVQDLLKDGKDLGRDASGNAILADVGPWLRDQFRAAFKACTCSLSMSAGAVQNNRLMSGRRSLHRAHRVLSQCPIMVQSADVKYIDPSYIIRTVPTISNDRIYCKILAHNAVHAAFGGYTGITVVSDQHIRLPAVTVQ
jgi:6-phosphofructokinase 1